ncbi:MAG: excinuclease ABC subunit C [Stygiobacter sp. RIFOXYC12_FULL_38_8]|nr:MAG: excinuclease ABC subunit C [Stygiobacter sp. GWC2_38_9]OGU79903.1 MAG: excinuclease ABC subunit C [Stygiobacter sp. RIFOXYA12_FULL_38_9]OGV09147.1 MAG: excinuclease ABC subunit C [Stygiobacter sp. RIFOXYB2_FULL_37_11]OGV13421.1 MAG: excinuclease ABC subunit C [Stygiobacter sp. RIFOXYA2_FULL_38_8]OGV16374.1 MAG: excinuclease ABC subunit C [Stygiobacter sp. RIFOXYC2_FULL_38_25]OGV27571.1 MAG: excinuclease ABC subunit C [Stygiobacter sp. RIFOXYC12_FULL_38_8]OGV81534.1 MAG: excinuclease A
MNCYTTNILFSVKKNKYYVGHTNNISRRLTEHNSGQNKSTKIGSPWELVYAKESDSKSEAYRFEINIKNRGASRFLSDNEKNG